jgi:hypothetical protein
MGQVDQIDLDSFGRIVSENRQKLENALGETVKLGGDYILQRVEVAGPDLRRYNINPADNLGVLSLASNPQELTAHVQNIGINEDRHQMGHATNIYNLLGDHLLANGITLESSQDMVEATQKIWQKLEQERKAVSLESNENPGEKLFKYIGASKQE